MKLKTWNIFCFLTLLIFGRDTFARYEIVSVQFECEKSLVCDRFARSFSRLKGVFETKDHFQTVLREYLSDVGYESLSFSLQGNDEQYALTIKIKPKSYIKEVQVLLNGYKDPLGLSDSLLTKPESYLDKEILQND